jgi:ubiquinone/menaquinone biosynthesis C-methylase UbiE
MDPKTTGLAADCRTHFDRQARHWEDKFDVGRSMSERPAVFVHCLQEMLGYTGCVLDFGCGPGDIAIACRRAGFQMSGVDISLPMIKRARWRSRDIGIAFTYLDQAEPLALPYADGEFDAITASSVLEYVRDPTDCFRELWRVCSPSGVLILTVPNLSHPRRWLEAALRPLLVLRRLPLKMKWRNYIEYLSISKNRLLLKQWSRLLVSAGWKLEQIRSRSEFLLLLVARKHE